MEKDNKKPNKTRTIAWLTLWYYLVAPKLRLRTARFVPHLKMYGYRSVNNINHGQRACPLMLLVQNLTRKKVATLNLNLTSNICTV